MQETEKVRRSDKEYEKCPKKRCRMTQTGNLAASWPIVLLVVVVTVMMLIALDGCKSSGARREAEPPAIALKPTLPSDEQAPAPGVGEGTETAVESAGSIVKITTSQGDILIELFDKQAPITAGSFLLLVEDGFYDGVVFHRIIPDFMAQGGDPMGTGGGGPGFTIPDETVPELGHDRGMVSMAKTAAPDSGGSQFFICYTRERTQHLDGVHSVFGRVIEGMEVADQLRKGSTMLKVTVERESPYAEAARQAAQAARVPE